MTGIYCIKQTPNFFENSCQQWDTNSSISGTEEQRFTDLVIYGKHCDCGTAEHLLGLCLFVVVVVTFAPWTSQEREK